MPDDNINRPALSRTIAVLNGKGGVGKTSVTANLAGLLAAGGVKVLAIDLDPQGNLGNDLGYLDPDDSSRRGDMGEGMVAAGATGKAPHVLAQVRKNLDVIAGGKYLHDLAFLLQARQVRDGSIGSLAASISKIAGDYDITIIDCPPGSEVLQTGALEAARWILIPTKTDDASRAGLRQVAERVYSARVTNPTLEIMGVVLFGVNVSAKRVIADAREALALEVGGSERVFDSMIRHVEAAAVDARNRGQLVFEVEKDFLKGPTWFESLKDPSKKREKLAASSGVLAADYAALAAETMKRMFADEAAESETKA